MPYCTVRALPYHTIYRTYHTLPHYTVRTIPCRSIVLALGSGPFLSTAKLVVSVRQVHSSAHCPCSYSRHIHLNCNCALNPAPTEWPKYAENAENAEKYEDSEFVICFSCRYHFKKPFMKVCFFQCVFAVRSGNYYLLLFETELTGKQITNSESSYFSAFSAYFGHSIGAGLWVQLKISLERMFREYEQGQCAQQ